MRKNLEDIYELSPMQQGMLFHTLYAPTSGVYYEQLNCTLQGDLNISAFKRAWQRVVLRHPALRTSFFYEDLEKPVQVVHKRVALTWDEQDWRANNVSTQQNMLRQYLAADQEKPFDVNKPPLMRFALLQLADDTYEFVWGHHHILLDGWSVANIFQEVFLFYEAFNQRKTIQLPRPRQYRDYILWLQQQDLIQAQAFWQTNLAGFRQATPLTSIAPEHEEEIEAAAKQFLTLPASLYLQLQAYIQQYHLTLNTIMQGVWGWLLSRYSNQDDVLFGSTVSGRPADLPGVEEMVGLFINTLPVRINIPNHKPVCDWLQQLQIAQVERESYAYAPLVDIQKWSSVPAGNSLFDTILVFENYPVSPGNADEENREASLIVGEISSFDQTNYPITIDIETGDKLILEVSYDNHRFTAVIITRILTHFQNVLTQIIQDPNLLVSQLRLHSADEAMRVAALEATAPLYF